MGSDIRSKTVYVNDLPIGQASTWAEVSALLAASGTLFTAKPGKTEGPSGFYLQGSTIEDGSLQRSAIRQDTSCTTQFLQTHDADVRQIARLLIACYGERAASHASLQGLEARRRGEPRHTAAWEWITEAVISAMRAEAESAEPHNRRTIPG